MFVTPEYNYGYPAAIKNAIDYLHQEWKDKPAGFVSYGGIAAGTRAVQQLKQVITTLRMVPVFESVNIPFHTQFIRGRPVRAPTTCWSKPPPRCSTSCCGWTAHCTRCAPPPPRPPSPDRSGAAFPRAGQEVRAAGR